MKGFNPRQQEPRHQECGKLQLPSRAHLRVVGTVRYSSNMVAADPFAQAEAEEQVEDGTAGITHSEPHDTPGEHRRPVMQSLAYNQLCQH